jgi:hypothetical protein
MVTFFQARALTDRYPYTYLIYREKAVPEPGHGVFRKLENG